jgi:ABC-type lipoprotein release transport system permease subunit
MLSLMTNRMTNRRSFLQTTALGLAALPAAAAPSDKIQFGLGRQGTSRLNEFMRHLDVAVVAVVGIYGLIAYSVSQRTSELAIRQALGARPLDILVLVAVQGLALTLLGVGLGSVADLAVTRLIGSVLFRVQPTDYVPAKRAIQIDPIKALR